MRLGEAPGLVVVPRPADVAVHFLEADEVGLRLLDDPDDPLDSVAPIAAADTLVDVVAQQSAPMVATSRPSPFSPSASGSTRPASLRTCCSARRVAARSLPTCRRTSLEVGPDRLAPTRRVEIGSRLHTPGASSSAGGLLPCGHAAEKQAVIVPTLRAVEFSSAAAALGVVGDHEPVRLLVRPSASRRSTPPASPARWCAHRRCSR